MHSYKSLSVAATALLAATACSVAPAAAGNERATSNSLTIEVSKIRNAKGRLMVALYDKGGAFAIADESKAFASISMKLPGTSARVTFDSLPSGNYAAMLFHDENANGNFDMKGGEPQEGYGISGAMHALDEPTFDKASVKVGKGKQTLTVKMQYYK